MKTENDLSHYYQKYLSLLTEQSKRSLSEVSTNQLNLTEFQNQFYKKELHNLDPKAKSRLQEEISAYGPLTPLLSQEDISEIMICDNENIWIERSGRIEKWTDSFFSQESYYSFLERLCYEAKIHFDLKKPIANGVWKNFRTHIIAPPLTAKHPCITLRRSAKALWTFKKLKDLDWANYESIQNIQSLVKDKKNILIIGPTGTGKTSVLNACLNEVSSHERIIGIEDTSEIQVPNSLSIKLLARTDTDTNLKTFSLEDLVKESLRMRPDRIVLGEVRGPEAKDLLMAFATGHRGGLATLHADNPQQALLRLEMLIQLGAPQWSLNAIRHLIKLSLDSIILLKRKKSQRVLAGIYQISSLERTGFCLDTVFEQV